MLDVRHLKAEDLQGLDAAAASHLATLLIERVATIDAEHDRQLSERDEQINFKDPKLQKLVFELARLKRLKFGAKTEAMTVDQRRLFEEALAEDEAAHQARIDALRGAKMPAPPAGEGRSKRQPRRQPIPEHLRRVEHRHEPEGTTCPAIGCGRPIHEWLRSERARVPDGSGIAGATDYSLNRWKPLGRFLDDGNLSCHNNHLENLMRPWAIGRKAWLFAGSELAGKRAATVMSLVQSARMYGHDPWAYLRHVLTRLPTHRACEINELLPHRWVAPNVG